MVIFNVSLHIYLIKEQQKNNHIAYLLSISSPVRLPQVWAQITLAHRMWTALRPPAIEVSEFNRL